MMSIVLDLQGFKIEKDKFIPKELAAFDGKRICHYVFKAPFEINLLSPSLIKQAEWLMKNHHCILWNQGFTPLYKFSEIVKNLVQKVDVVYVKGEEKSKYLKKYSTKPIINLEEASRIQPKEAKCFYHSNLICICALTNVYELYNNYIMDE